MAVASITAITDVAPHVERLIDDREAQGFGRKVSEPVVIERVAAIVRGSKP